MVVVRPPEMQPEHDPALAPDAGVIDEARARQRRHRSGAAAVATALAVVLGLVFAGGGGHAGSTHRATASARSPVTGTQLTVAACVSRITTTKAKPSRAILSILGVLRRPAGPADALPSRFRQSLVNHPIGGAQVFVNYVRLARTTATGSYFIYPVQAPNCGPLARTGQTIAVAKVADHCGADHGAIGTVGGITVAGIESGKALAYGGDCSHSLDSSLVFGVVPDGVATVALHYPAGRIGGYSHKTGPAATVTTKVVGNVIAVMVPRGGGNGGSWRTMTWRAADGHVVKTLTGR
jgi:hypothetical protein